LAVNLHWWYFTSIWMIDLTSCLKSLHPDCFCPQGLWKHDVARPESSKSSLRSLPAKTHSWDMFLPLCQESQLLANHGHQLQSFQRVSPSLRPLKLQMGVDLPKTLIQSQGSIPDVSERTMMQQEYKAEWNADIPPLSEGLGVSRILTAAPWCLHIQYPGNRLSTWF